MTTEQILSACNALLAFRAVLDSVLADDSSNAVKFSDVVNVSAWQRTLEVSCSSNLRM